MSIASRGRILGKLFGCLVLFAAHESLAEVLVDPDVMAVVEGGYWREDGVGEGSYRIIVVIRPLTDQNPFAQALRPIDMMRQGWFSSFRQALQQ